ncbi:extracellular solute-binding protein [Devosia algicola]|uniref:Extracellular solute-binding protein n=1 Tax=Devosia algicola TaxID=3026418 RepID=A0ABY7YJ53_9HYPH|nr:extracellular solute-binding protein [Devosia algicola]WDR01281.1 extracellular solute-binding protein [Devosia algicola]
MSAEYKTDLKWKNWSRRQVLGVAVSAMALTTGISAFSPAMAQDKPFDGSKLTYWGGLIFADEANKLLVDTINQWGADNGVETEVVMINQNETIQKVSAAVESNTLPDALDLSVDLLLLMSRQGIFINIDDLYKSVGDAHGGWYDAIDLATDTTDVAGGRTGLPFGASGNLLLRRTDLLEPAGFSSAPTTWDELVEQAEAVNAMPVSGLGLALSNVGDANVQLSVLQSYGGRMADDTGTKVTIKSEETRAYLTWLKNAWDKGLFPPGNATWDGAGDNQAYLSGQAAFIANTGSVGIAAKSQDPELYDDTAYSALPAGPMGTVSPMTPQVRAIPATSTNQEAAKALLEYLSQPEFLDAYYALAIYGPVLKDSANAEAFNGEDPIHAGLLNLVENGTAPGYPDVYNAAYADASSNFIVPKMAQRVVIDGWDFDRAMDEAQSQAQAIYDKY